MEELKYLSNLTTKKKYKGRFTRKTNVWYIFLLPTLIGVALFMVYPIIEGFRLSFYQSNGTIEKFVGLSNYKYVLTNADFLKAIFNTFFMTFFQLVVTIPFGFVIAVTINGMLWGKNFLKALFFIPYITPAVAAGMLFLFILHPDGILNQFLGFFGISPIIWLENGLTARFGVVFLGIWKSLGFTIVIFFAYLQAISKEYYEAAYIDGCTRLKSHIYITIPHMYGAFSFLIIIGWIQGLQRFTEVYILGGSTGNPAKSLYTIVGFIYERGFGNYEFGVASAASYVLFILVIIFTCINMKVKVLNK